MNNPYTDKTEDREPEGIDTGRMYREELGLIRPCTAEEAEELAEELLTGSRRARERLIEGHLALAARVAQEYGEQGLSLADLVQEANMALLLAVARYEGGNFPRQAENQIREALEEALEAQRVELQVEEELLARVNVLKDISAMLAEELGREATVEELAERMKMTAREIRDIMKLTLDAVNASGEQR